MTISRVKREGSVLLLDGGMGKHLERHGAPFRQPEWSALALIEDPDSVRDAHRAFIASGAQVITVNSYAVVPFHLGEDLFSARGRELADLAGRLAREAADESDREILVAGSLPPLFGSYEPQSFVPERAPVLYEMLVAAQAPHVDLWIAETVSSIAEGNAIADAVDAQSSDRDLWISLTVPDAEITTPIPLRSGESVTAAVEALADRCSAMLFNCSSPEAISVALAELKAALVRSGSDVRFGAYANAFEPRPAGYSANEVLLDARAEITPERYLSVVSDWVEAGATIVGGCCQIHTEHIEALAHHFSH